MSDALHASEHVIDASHEKHYVKIWAILVVLLIVSWAGPSVAEHTMVKGSLLRLVFTLVTAFGIAVVKAYFVIKNFMHLHLEPKFLMYVCVTSLGLVALFFFFVAPDVMNHEGENWTNVAAMSVTGEQPRDTNIRLPDAHHANEFDAATSFATICAGCHGPTGGGDGPAAAALNPHPANFTDPTFWETRDREHIITVIRDGGAAVGKSPIMASFRTTFTTDEQLGAMADVVMGFAPEQAAPAEQAAPILPAEAAPASTPGSASASASEPATVPAGPPAEEVRQRGAFIRGRLFH